MDNQEVYNLIRTQGVEIMQVMRETKAETDKALGEIKKTVDKHNNILNGRNGDAGLCENQRKTESEIKLLTHRFNAYTPKIKNLVKTRDRISWAGTLITGIITACVSGVAFLFMALKFIKYLKETGMLQ